MSLRAWIVVAALLVPSVAVAQTQRTIKLGGREVSVAIPYGGWNLAEADGAWNLTNPAAASITINLGAEAWTGSGNAEEAAFLNCKTVAEGVQGKQPGLTQSNWVKRPFAGGNGTYYTLKGTAGGRQMEIWILVSISGDMAYTGWLVGTAADVQAYRPALLGFLDSVKPSGASASPPKQETPSAPAAPPKPTVPAWSKEPALEQPPPGKPLVDDPVLGVYVDGLPDWGVGVNGGEYLLEKRLAGHRRVLVGFFLGDAEFAGDGAKYVKAATRGEDTEWEWYAGRTTLVRKFPPTADGETVVHEYHVLRRGRTLVVRFRVDGGMQMSDYDAAAARTEVEKVLRISEPGRIDGGRKAVVPLGNRVVDVPLGKDWKLGVYGPGAQATFAGPKGVTARVVVSTRRGDLPGVTCADGTRPDGTAVKIAGKDARKFGCPSDTTDQVSYEIQVGKSLVYVYLSDEAGGAAKGPVAKFVDGLRFP